MNDRILFIGVLVTAMCAASCKSVAKQSPSDSSLIKNGSFNRDLSEWSVWFAPGQSDGEARWVKRDDGGAMEVQIRRRDTWSSIQIYQGPFTVKKGRWYAISFEARAVSEPMNMRVMLMKNNPPWGSLGLKAEVALGTNWQRMLLLAQATEDWDDARLDFFPEKSFRLDNVRIRELEKPPALLPVKDVIADKNWRGKPAALTDGNPKSALVSNYYPTLPIFVTLDLGEIKPVCSVVIRTEDRGRHVSTRKLRVELSCDGKQWLFWSQPPKTVGEKAGGKKIGYFNATNIVVPVRYVRIRVLGLRGVAVLTEAQVFGIEGAAPSDLSQLPKVPPEDDLVFIGWDYEKLGYALSPDEKPSLRFLSKADSPIETDLKWRLETYAGDEIANGKTAFSVTPYETADVPLKFPSNLSDGAYRLRFRLGKSETEHAFYFDYRVAKQDANLTLRLVALLDNQDAEGWVKLMTGRLSPFVDVRRSLPDSRNDDVDAVLAAAENASQKLDLVKRLRRYIRDGGRAMFFAKVCPSMKDMLPVEIDYDDPWAETPQRLKFVSFWRQFDSEKAPRQYAVRVRPKDGAKVLAQWEDGSTAVVEGSYGKGRVIYIGTPMGRLWQWKSPLEEADELTLRALYYLLDRRDIENSLKRLTDEIAREEQQRRAALSKRLGNDIPEGAREGASFGNVGRFGWLVREGLLVENLMEDAKITSPISAIPWRITVPERGAVRGRTRELNYISKVIEWRDGEGVVFTSTVSVASPLILHEGNARRLLITGKITHVAVETGGSVRVLSDGDEVAGKEMSASWIVLLNTEAEERDSPRVIVLSRRPQRIYFDGEVEILFDQRGFGAVWTGRLFGLRRFAPGETRKWVDDFPDKARRQARRLAAQALAFPVACDEVFYRADNSIAIVNRFGYRTFSDDWGTKPEKVAPLPPVLSLLRNNGFPVRVDGEVAPAGVATKYGPLEFVSGETVAYRLPLPPLDHFGVIPVKGKMELQEAIDHYALQGIKSVKRASGGLTTSDAFLADLRRYMAGSTVPPFEAPCIDLYKWWYCFPTVSGRPALSSEIRGEVDAHYRRQYWQTLNFYSHRTIIRYRREPNSKLDYVLSFIWPVVFRDGVRFFVDQNESASVVLYCMECYARYYGDWTTVASNWNLFRGFHRYLRRVHDWALMASSNQEFFSSVGIDMLNSEYPGNLAFARMARRLGDKRSEDWGLYLAAKAMIPAIARLYMPDYIRSITADGDPWRERRFFWSFKEVELTGQKSMIQRGDTDFIVALGGGMLDTSKGTSPEIALLYKFFVPKRMERYERAVQETEREHDVPPGWAHLMQRAFLGWDRAKLIAGGKRHYKERPNWGWQATKAPHNLAVVCVIDAPLFLADWAPAGYITGQFDPSSGTITLLFENREADSFHLRLYSQYEPKEVFVGGEPVAGWRYDAKTGWLSLKVNRAGKCNLEIRLGQERKAPLHPYFAGGND